MMKKTCLQCKKEFEIKKYIGTTAYCSQKCQRQHNVDKRREVMPKWMTDIDEMIKAAHS